MLKSWVIKILKPILIIDISVITLYDRNALPFVAKLMFFLNSIHVFVMLIIIYFSACAQASVYKAGKLIPFVGEHILCKFNLLAGWFLL